MKKQWRRWTSTSPVFQPSDGLDLLFIDENNNVVNAQRLAKEVNWHDTGNTILAWRLIPVAEPSINPDHHAGTAYWNYRSGKFWPFSAKRPPNPKLPYFRIEIWTRPDGSSRLEYFLPAPPVLELSYPSNEA